MADAGARIRQEEPLFKDQQLELSVDSLNREDCTVKVFVAAEPAQSEVRSSAARFARLRACRR